MGQRGAVPLQRQVTAPYDAAGLPVAGRGPAAGGCTPYRCWQSSRMLGRLLTSQQTRCSHRPSRPPAQGDHMAMRQHHPRSGGHPSAAVRPHCHVAARAQAPPHPEEGQTRAGCGGRTAAGQRGVGSSCCQGREAEAQAKATPAACALTAALPKRPEASMCGRTNYRH